MAKAVFGLVDSELKPNVSLMALRLPGFLIMIFRFYFLTNQAREILHTSRIPKRPKGLRQGPAQAES